MTEVANKSTTLPHSPTADWLQTLRRMLKVSEFVIFLVVLFLLLFGSLINPRVLGIENLKIITRDTAILAIAALGVAFPIITGGIDLSIGSVIGLGGVLSTYFIVNWGVPIVPGILLALLIGVMIGWVHGLFVTRLNMHGFLITLVTLGVARGAILVITNGIPITGVPDAYTYLGQGYLFKLIPIPVILCALVALLAHYLLRYTYIGRQIYAVGGNIEATRLSGVNVNARIVLCYIVAVVCSSLVGVIQAGRLSLGHPGTGEGYELLAITACILGGLSLMGGQGSVPGILVGSALIGVLQNLMVMLNINPYWHKIVIGLVLLAAITFDYLRRKQKR